MRIRSRGLLASIALDLLVAAPGLSAVPQLTTLDSTGNVGMYTSVAIGADGMGLISYYDATNGNLKVAHCENAACTSATLSTLDSAGDVGRYTSIAIGADGRGLIGYYDATNGDLKVAHCENAACTSATLSTLDSTGDVGLHPSVVIGADGLGLISYGGENATGLKLAHCSDLACSTATTRATALFPSGCGSASHSAAIGSDDLGLFSCGGSPIRVAHCSDVPCSSSTASTLNDLNGGGAKATSIVAGPGHLPWIVWSLGLIPELLVYRCDDPACVTATLGRLASWRDDYGAFAHDARLGGDGRLLVAFEHGLRPNPTGGWLPVELRVLHCTDDLCSAGEITVLDEPGNPPSPYANDPIYPALAIGTDGLGLVSYYNAKDGDLKVAKCGNASCTSPSLSIDDVTVTVGTAQTGPVVARFPVTLSAAGTEPVRVAWATHDGTATAPADYEAASGVLTFGPGETSQAVEVSVPGSLVPRPDLNFSVELSNPEGALLSRGLGVGTIVTRIPAFSVDSPSISRSATESTTLRFRVSLFPTAAGPASIRASTVTGGTATPGADYIPTSEVLSFAVGETDKYLDVPVPPQWWGEPEKTVIVNLTEATGAQVSGLGSGLGRIFSPSTATVPEVLVQDVTVAEGDEGVTALFFTLSLSAGSGETVTVGYRTLDDTASAGQDYESASGSVSFSPEARTRTVRVFVKGNTVVESDRRFALALDTVTTNATIDRSPVYGWIRDDDLKLAFRAEPVMVRPGIASTLRWAAIGGALLTLDGSPVTGPEGSAVVTPSSTRTYQLIANLSAAATDRYVTVNVDLGAAPLPAPTVSSPASGSTALVSGVTLSWSEVAGAAGYDLRVFDAGNGKTLFTGTLAGQHSTSTLVSLPDGGHLVAVRACNSLVAGDATCGKFGTSSFEVERVRPPGRPAVTQPTTGALLTTSTQTLAWTAVTPDPRLPQLFYEVKLEDVSVGATVLQITVPDPETATIFTLGSSTEFHLRVRACQAACGDWSDPVTFSVSLPAVPTDAPSFGDCTVAEGNSLTCSWSPVPHAESYEVQVVQPAPAGPGGGALTVASRQVSTTTVTLPVPAGLATVYLAACNGDGCGPYATTDVAAAGPNPAQPILGAPTAGRVVQGPGLLFTWNRIPGDDGTNTWYRLYVQDLSRQAAALDVYTRSDFHAAYFRAEGARYDAVVVANPGLPSQVQGPSQGFNVSGTSATAPTMVAPGHDSEVVSGNVQLGWSPVPGSTLYEYYVAVLGMPTPVTRGVTPGLLAYVPLSGTGAGTVHSGIVRACPAGATCEAGSDAGWGPWSNAPGGPGVTNFTVVP